MIKKTKKKVLTMGVSTFILYVLMCLHSVVHNKTQGKLYIPGFLFVGFVVRWKLYLKTYATNKNPKPPPPPNSEGPPKTSQTQPDCEDC